MKNPFIFTLFVLCLLACTDTEKRQTGRIVNEWMGKKINIPHLVYTIQGKDTIEFHPADYEYKILSYADSSGCTGCKMNLEEWADYIEMADSVYGDRVGFVFYYSPKSRADAIHYLEMADFRYPVCVDSANVLGRGNGFPADERFHTFLLDRNNEIVAIGNPTKNEKIEELYKRIINKR